MMSKGGKGFDKGKGKGKDAKGKGKGKGKGGKDVFGKGKGKAMTTNIATPKGKGFGKPSAPLWPSESVAANDIEEPERSNAMDADRVPNPDACVPTTQAQGMCSEMQQHVQRMK